MDKKTNLRVYFAIRIGIYKANKNILPAHIFSYLMLPHPLYLRVAKQACIIFSSNCWLILIFLLLHIISQLFPTVTLPQSLVTFYT